MVQIEYFSGEQLSQLLILFHGFIKTMIHQLSKTCGLMNEIGTALSNGSVEYQLTMMIVVEGQKTNTY